MLSDGNLFESIMELKPTRIPERKLQRQLLKTVSQELFELNQRYSYLVKQAKNRELSLEQVLEIREELADLRRHKKNLISGERK